MNDILKKESNNDGNFPSETPVNEKSVKKYTLIRWILFLPIAILAAIVITFPLHFILYSSLSGGTDPIITPYPELPEKLLQPFCSGLVFVFVSAIVAPKYKSKIAAITTTTWSILSIVAFVLGYSKLLIGRTTLYLDYWGFPIIFGIAGAVIGYILFKKVFNTTQ